MQKRVWIKSGIVEELDQRQSALLKLANEKIVFYYKELYQTRACYQYPLSLKRLMKLTNRSSHAVTLALRYLANTVPLGSQAEPTVYYHRRSAQKNASHRPYCILLRKKGD